MNTAARLFLSFWIVSVLGLPLTGCDRIRESRSINVTFSSAPAFKVGAPVVLGEHRVGTVRDVRIVAGKLRLRASVMPDALPARVVFLATTDASGMQSLLGFALPPAGQTLASPDDFVGTDSLIGLTAMLGEENAKAAVASARQWLLKNLAQ
jgi:hypothetical protein